MPNGHDIINTMLRKELEQKRRQLIHAEKLQDQVAINRFTKSLALRVEKLMCAHEARELRGFNWIIVYRCDKCKTTAPENP